MFSHRHEISSGIACILIVGVREAEETNISYSYTRFIGNTEFAVPP